MLDEIIPMVQRMLIDTTLGEQEKLRLLLISLSSARSSGALWSTLLPCAPPKVCMLSLPQSR